MVQKAEPVIPGLILVGDGSHLPKNGMHNLCIMELTGWCATWMWMKKTLRGFKQNVQKLVAVLMIWRIDGVALFVALDLILWNFNLQISQRTHANSVCPQCGEPFGMWLVNKWMFYITVQHMPGWFFWLYWLYIHSVCDVEFIGTVIV